MRISGWSADVCSSDLEDIKLLAKHFGIDAEKAEKRFTKKGFKEEGMETRPRVLRHQDDEHFGSICTFFDTDKRRCTIYEARPEICREYPGRKRCGYYDFLRSEEHTSEIQSLKRISYAVFCLTKKNTTLHKL